jgi:hypothetical protein
MPIAPDDDLTPAERAEVTALSRERLPSPEVEERIVEQLRAHGVIRSVGVVTRSSLRWRVLAAAASIALFVAGFGAGRVSQSAGLSGFTPAGTSGHADQIQRAALDYVRAIAVLADTTVPVAQNDDAREAIVTTLGAVANEVLRVAPDDPLAASILSGLEWRGRTPQTTSATVPARRVAWF